MIFLTEKAVHKIKEIAEAEEVGHYVIRAKVIGSGCAGFSNDMFFDNNISEDDEITELDGVKLIIDPLSFQYLDGSHIDYIEAPMGGGFKFLNPNIKASCGCGSSYSV